MSHIPDQLNKINSNIQEAETILTDLKNQTKTENVAEQIEHFESMLNKLNNLKDSYLQLSAQFETSSKMKNSLISVTSALQNNNQPSSDDQLDQLRHERDRQKNELQVQQSKAFDSKRTCSLNVDVSSRENPVTSQNTFTDLVSDLDNFIGLDLSFYKSILDHHIDIGSKMIEMVEGLSLSDNLQQGIYLLTDVIQKLMELRERFESVENTKENIRRQGVDENTMKREMETVNAIFEDLKASFATGVKCFKSAMDIIQSHLHPSSIQVHKAQSDLDQGNQLRDGITNASTMLPGDDVSNGNNKNHSGSASDDNNNRSNEEEIDDNNDGGDEESEDSCREKDQDESMEIGAGTSANDSINEQMDHKVMRHLRLQTEFEQKEIMKLLEEKRIMQKKLTDLKNAKEVTKNQALNLTQSGNIFGNFSQFLCSSQSSQFGGDSSKVLSNSQRPDSLALRTGDMVSDMGSLLKLLSDMKSEVQYDDSYQNSPSRMSHSNTHMPHLESIDASTRVPFNCNSYPTHTSIQAQTLNEKTEELKQKQCQIQKIREMLDHIKGESLTLNDSLAHDSNDEYHSDHNNGHDIGHNGRHGKGRDSVTFQEPVATFIANEELYENMREVRMRREEQRDRSARNSNSDPRSPSGRVLDTGNAPGAPPEVPARMPTTSHETASQDRTTAATWGSSSGGGDDYEDRGCGNELSRDNLCSDERSRVAPVGQSSTFRSKVRDSTNVIDNDVDNLKGQIENIASLCRNMALEQSRLARDIADLKSGSSPRVPSNGPDLVMSGVSKHGTLTDDNLQQWAASSNASARMATTVVDSCPRPNHMDSSWEEASIASSTALQHQLHQQRQSSAWYCPPQMPAPTYHTVLQQQNIILQNHALFLKLQMSLVASQLEQQRLCTLAMQQCGSVSQVPWSMTPFTPPYYPPPGPLISVPDSGSLGAPLLPSVSELDCGMYTLYTHDPAATSAPLQACNTNNNPWKSSLGAPGRNVHRN